MGSVLPAGLVDVHRVVGLPHQRPERPLGVDVALHRADPDAHRQREGQPAGQAERLAHPVPQPGGERLGLGPRAVLADDAELVPADDPWVASLPAPVRPTPATYFTDASVLVQVVQGAPIVVWGPGTPAVMHAIDEYVELAELEQAAAAFSDVVARWGGSS